jgi:hypothetical protein
MDGRLCNPPINISMNVINTSMNVINISMNVINCSNNLGKNVKWMDNYVIPLGICPYVISYNSNLNTVVIIITVKFYNNYEYYSDVIIYWY